MGEGESNRVIGEADGEGGLERSYTGGEGRGSGEGQENGQGTGPEFSDQGKINFGNVDGWSSVGSGGGIVLVVQDFPELVERGDVYY